MDSSGVVRQEVDGHRGPPDEQLQVRCDGPTVQLPFCPVLYNALAAEAKKIFPLFHRMVSNDAGCVNLVIKLRGGGRSNSPPLPSRMTWE